MKALIIYDNTGKIWNIVYGSDEAPQGLQSMFVDIPDGAVLESIDVTDLDDPRPVFSYLPDSDIGQLQKKVASLEENLELARDTQEELREDIDSYNIDLDYRLSVMELGL